MDYSRLKQLGTKKKFSVTKEGLDSLRKQLDVIMHEKIEALKRIRRMDDDTKSDSLTLADEVRRLEAAEVEATNINDLLQHIEPVIKPQHPVHIQVGSVVILEKNKARQEYTVVSPLESNIAFNKISDESPLGSALLGKRPGDIVSITTRKGTVSLYTIIDIK